MVDGVPPYGHRSLVSKLGGQGLETLRVGGRERVLKLREQSANPRRRQETLAEAKDRLTHALKHLKQLAERAEQSGGVVQAMSFRPEDHEVRWGLTLDELELGRGGRPHMKTEFFAVVHGHADPTGRPAP